MTDFDKLFENYMAKWFAAHKGEYTADEAEDKIPELYDEWARTPAAEIGGISPERYFLDMTDPAAMIAEFEAEVEECGGPCSLLVERIADTPECAAGLTALALSSSSPECVLSAMDVLDDMGARQPLNEYAGWLARKDLDDGVRERAAEILKEHAAEVKDTLIAMIPAADDEVKDMLADVLCEAGHDERTFNLLREVFLSGRNVPYAAGLIGKYGDERAAAFLYPALDNCNYLEFIEIRNAIEQLGGVVDDSYRDFSDDEFYKALKNLK